MSKSLNGTTVWITGASSGIGRAAALEYAARGANVALVARNAQRLEETRAAAEAFGVKAASFVADITQPAKVEAAFRGAVAAFDKIDVAVCNAGIYMRKAASELSTEEIRGMMETNFYGNLNCIYTALPYFRDRGAGSIVTVISMDAKKGMPPDAAYVASKFALGGFNQVLRQEMRGSGVHIGAVFPSHTDTPQMDSVTAPKIAEKMRPEQVARAIVRCAEKRKKEILVPFFSCKLLVWADAISPSFSDWLDRAFHLGGEDIEKNEA